MIAPGSKKAFQQLVEKYQDGKATPEERAFIEKYYQYFDKEATATAEMTTEEKNSLENGLWQKIRDAVEQDAPQVVPFYRRTWLRVAAAAVLLFVVGGLWFVVGRRGSDKPEVVQVPVVQDASPGGNKAVLTLADGTKITLDSAANGAVAQQGGVRVMKLQDGEVAYSRESGVGSREPIQYNTMSTPRGGRYQLQLPDGSKIWLNAASSVTYPTIFAGNDRKIKVTGEVYLEVAKNKEKPFIVDVDGKQTVEVLGTHFNINSYNDEDAIRTTLLEGKVKVSVTGSRLPTPDSRLLSPGEQAILSDHITVTDQISIDQIMAWKNGLFQFEYTPISTVLRQMSRWYDVDIVYEKNVPDIKLVGEIGRDLTLTQALRGLGKIGVQYRIEGKKLIILEK